MDTRDLKRWIAQRQLQSHVDWLEKEDLITVKMNYKKTAKLLGREMPKNELEEVSLKAQSVGYQLCLFDFLSLAHEGLNLDIIFHRLIVKYDAIAEAFNEKEL